MTGVLALQYFRVNNLPFAFPKFQAQIDHAALFPSAAIIAPATDDPLPNITDEVTPIETTPASPSVALSAPSCADSSVTILLILLSPRPRSKSKQTILTVFPRVRSTSATMARPCGPRCAAAAGATLGSFDLLGLGGGDYYVSIPRPFKLTRGVWTDLIRSRSGVGISPFPRIAGRRLRAGPDMVRDYGSASPSRIRFNATAIPLAAHMDGHVLRPHFSITAIYAVVTALNESLTNHVQSSTLVQPLG